MSNDGESVAVLGCTGYTGLELVNILSRHSKVNIVYLGSENHAGENIHKFDKRIHNYQLPLIDSIENFDIKNNTCLWGIYRDLSIKSNIKYGSIILYLTFENLFSQKKIKSVKCQVLKDLEWIKDWYIRWGHKLENFDEKKKCFNLFLEKDKWNEIKNTIYDKLNFK